MRVDQLDRSLLPAARDVLADACAFDRAADVAGEKLFGAGPASVAPAAAPPSPGTGSASSPAVTLPVTLGAWDGPDLVGVAAYAARWVRILAVRPAVRGRGVGSALLAACEAGARASGETRLSALDQPGNYLAPGIDARNTETIAWLERRGWQRKSELRTNVLIAVRGNPRVTAERAAELVHRAAERGYEVRRARPDEHALLAAVATEFGGAWPFELERALGYSPAGVHVALRDGAYCAFAAHDGNNRGLGWFGPTGTWPAHRGQGLGEAVLVACLVDVAAAHDFCEVAWIGPRPFYDKVAGVAHDRHFVGMAKVL